MNLIVKESQEHGKNTEDTKDTEIKKNNTSAFFTSSAMRNIVSRKKHIK